MMKKVRWPFLAAELILLVLLLLCVVRIFNQNVPQKRVAVVLPDSGDEGWDLLIAGMKQAAEQEDIHLIICNTDELESADAQAEIIKEQVDNNIDGVILRPTPGNDTKEMLEENLGTYPLMLVTEGLYGEETGNSSLYPVVGPDNYALGYKLGQLIESENPKLGVVAGWQEDEATVSAIEGLEDALKEKGGEILWYSYEKKEQMCWNKLAANRQWMSCWF